MTDRAELVDALAEALRQAARASVAKGAQYVPGEPLNLDVESLWKGVAEGLVKLVEKVIDERRDERMKGDVKRT